MKEVKANPTLHEILEGYKRFNAWEREEQRRALPGLTIEKGLTQFFELCSLTRTLSPDASQIFFKQDTEHWATLHKKLQRAAKTMVDAQTA